MKNMKIKKLTQYYTLKNSNTQLKIISFQHCFNQSHTPINNSQTKNGYKPNKNPSEEQRNWVQL